MVAKLRSNLAGYDTNEVDDALRRLATAGKLVLDSTSARMDDEAMFAVFERLGGPDAAAAAREFWADPNPLSLGDYGRLCIPLYSRRGAEAWAEVMDMQARSIVNLEVLTHFATNIHKTFDFSAGLSRITCPTLVLGGDDDPVCPLVGTKEIAARIGDNARLVTYAGGHGMPTEQKDQFFALLAEFVAG